MTDEPPTTPAGWYPDPSGAPGQRYWDGTAWTDQEAPPTSTQPQPATEVLAHGAPPRNGLGIAALILGIIGAISGLIPLLFWIAGTLGVIGLILGFVGRARAKRGEATNGRTALWGIITSAIALILSIVGMVIVFDAFGDAADELEGITAEPTATAETAGPETPVDSPAEPADTPEPEPLPDYGNFTDLNAMTYDDGLGLQVDSLEEFTPSEFAAYDEAPAYLRFTMTITNETGAEFDPSLFTTTAQSGGREASEIFDSESGLEGAPMTTILPGGSVEFAIGYSVEDPADFVLEVSPSFDHESTIFRTE